VAKKLYYKLYWAEEAPAPQDSYMNRYNVVRNGAGSKGSVIGALGTGAKLRVDMNEQDEGWVRIISVVGKDPVPETWIDIMEDKGVPQVDWEWWVDKTAITPINAPGTDLKLEITVHPDMSYEVKKIS